MNRVELSQSPVSRLRRYFDLLLSGDSASLQAIFATGPRLDTPLAGAISGVEAFDGYVRAQAAWLAERNARPEFLNLVAADERFVLEFVLYLEQAGQEIDLPVALVADRAADAIAALRLYHSTWPLSGAHRLRAPLIPLPEQPLDEPAVIQAYMKGLSEADTELVLSLFVDDGYAREPSGARYKHAGREGLRQFYGPALADGGIILHHCSATGDGRACAIEYIAAEWGGVKLPPQAGVAVYELAGPNRLRAARIYDDVEPPFA